MDEELKALEAELQQLKPRQPSLQATRRIADALSRPAEPSRRTHEVGWWLGVAAIPLAAAIVAIVGLSYRRPPASQRPVAQATPVADRAPASSREILEPTAAENILYDVRDEGLVVLDGGIQARRERLKYIDTIVWEDSRSRASLRWSVPREEVRIVPVRVQ